MNKIWLGMTGMILALAPFSVAKITQGNIPVIVYLKDQPFSQIASDVRKFYEDRIEALVDSIRSIQKRHVIVESKRRDKIKRTPLSDEEVNLVRRWSRELRILKGEMRTQMYERARAIIDAGQTALARYIELQGGKVNYKYTIVNAIAARIPKEKLGLIKKRPEVDHITEDVLMTGHINTSTHSIFVDTFWNNGYTGGPTTGPWCAVIDCGIDWNHPALNSFSWYYDSVFHQTAQDSANYNDNPNSTDDFQGHGTHIAGIIWSKGSTGWSTYKGVAYGDDHVINAKAGYRNTSGGASMYWSDAMAAVEWAINAPGVWADVINFSYGSSYGWTHDDSDFSRFWDAVCYDEWVVVAVSAGNDGPYSTTIEDPGISYNVITVGALHDHDTPNRSDDGIPNYTSRGPTVGGRKKPDIVAPGGDDNYQYPITSTRFNWEGNNSDFWNWYGTSFAAPHVAAAVVLLGQALSYNPLPMEAKAIFINNSDDWSTPGWDAATGWGYINLDRVYKHMTDCFHYEYISDTNTFKIYKGVMYQGDRATLVWQRPAYYNPGGYPTSYANLKNLDLFLYRESDNTLLDSSVSDTDNVEVVVLDQDSEDVVIKTKLVLPPMWIPPYEERYALATEEGFTVPQTELFHNIPFVVAGQNDTFDLKVIVSNRTGSRVNLHNNYVYLHLPMGFQLISGDNPHIIQTIQEQEVDTVSWQILAPNINNSFIPFLVSDTSYSYGEKIFSSIEGEFFVTSSTMSQVFYDDFNDCDISDWDVHAQNGTFNHTAWVYLTGPCALYMNSQGNAYAYGLTPDFSFDFDEPYVINTYFMIPNTNNHWILVLDNHQVHIVIDQNSDLKAWQGSYGGTKFIQTLNTGQWYKITCYADPSVDSYSVYVDGVFKIKAHFFEDTAYHHLRLGDIESGSANYGTAYWDEISVFGKPTEILFTRGDANADTAVNVTDAVYILSHLFPFPVFPCVRTADTNLDSSVNTLDVTYFLAHLFPSPSLPPPDSCGINPADTLPCDSFPPCGSVILSTYSKVKGDVRLEFGEVEVGKGYSVVPLYLRTDVPVAGFQIKLGYDGNYDVRVETEGCVTEGYDYFDSYLGSGKVMIVSIVSLEPGVKGKVTRYMGPGRYRVANIKVRGKEAPEFRVEESVFSDLYGYTIEPIGGTEIGEVDVKKPKRFKLIEAMPNPFKNRTLINYALPRDCNVEIEVFNVMGRRVRTLVNGYQSVGYKSVTWDGTDENGKKLPQGVYFYELKASKHTFVKKLILLR